MPVKALIADREYPLRDIPQPLDNGVLLSSPSSWEVEIGFGKAKYLLRRAADEPRNRFIGVEMANAYYRLAAKRARRQGLQNVVLVRGEALFAISAILPAQFADAVHVYFPDPWPKARHQKRRLFDPETVDLVLGLLKPDGVLYFATDHLDYGKVVCELLESHPAVGFEEIQGPWADGPRTNYEAKYESEGRPILRVEVHRRNTHTTDLIHPRGAVGIVSAIRHTGAGSGNRTTTE